MAFETPDVEVLLDYALALGLGGLIGLERERHRTEKVVLAGVRTFPLVSLGGLLAASLADQLGTPSLVSVGALIAGGFALLMYWVRQQRGTLGLTSPIALFATYFVGVLVGVGRESEAIVAGLAIAVLLFTKERLHKLADVLTPSEMEGALYFLVLAFILYPITPERLDPPWDVVHPRQALLIVLLVSLISFLSFLAIRRWGTQFGLPFSGFLGGLVNSEATTVSLAQLHRKRPSLESGAVVGILLANATLFVRNTAIAGIADPTLDLARKILVPMLWAALAYTAWALVALNRFPARHRETIKLKSPFAFRPAFIFAFWFGLVSVLTVLVTRETGFNDRGVYAAAIGGLVSAGAVTASMGALVAAGNVGLDQAAIVVVLASLLSAADKIVIARWATRGVAGRLVGPTLLAVTVGGALLYFTW